MKKLVGRKKKNFSDFWAAMILAVFMMCLCGSPVHACVTYQFDFSNTTLTGGAGGRAGFSVTIVTTDYITTTGMQPLGYTITTSYASLGYNIKYFGENQVGTFGFDDDGSAILTDDSFTWNGWSFDFHANSNGYITSPGVWEGAVFGNGDPHGMRGGAMLTVTATRVPEPFTMLFLALTLSGLGLFGRRFMV